MGFRYQLRWADGDDAGEAEYPDGGIEAGDEIRINGNRLVRVRAVIPVELAAEFVDGASTAHSRSKPMNAPPDVTPIRSCAAPRPGEFSRPLLVCGTSPTSPGTD